MRRRALVLIGGFLAVVAVAALVVFSGGGEPQSLGNVRCHSPHLSEALGPNQALNRAVVRHCREHPGATIRDTYQGIADEVVNSVAHGGGFPNGRSR